jgi:Tetratricopeptide repeat
LGQLDQARTPAERALTITEAAYGPDHPKVASIRSKFAQLLDGLE